MLQLMLNIIVGNLLIFLCIMNFLLLRDKKKAKIAEYTSRNPKYLK